MIVTGIVAEYNPFHNGHRYLIESVRGLYPGGSHHLRNERPFSAARRTRFSKQMGSEQKWLYP